jgi:predicted nucleic acid-binding protein
MIPRDKNDAELDFDGRQVRLTLAARRPLPDNDIWIAALAIQHELTLVSRDKHFKEVSGLKVEFW